MDDKLQNQNQDKGGNQENMVLRSIFVDRHEWDQAKTKAKRTRTPIAQVIRLLLKKWLKGEISLTINGDEEN